VISVGWRQAALLLWVVPGAVVLLAGNLLEEAAAPAGAYMVVGGGLLSLAGAIVGTIKYIAWFHTAREEAVRRRPCPWCAQDDSATTERGVTPVETRARPFSGRVQAMSEPITRNRPS